MVGWVHGRTRLWILAAGIAAMYGGGAAPAGASPIVQLPGPLGCLTPGGAGGCADSGPLLGARAIAIAPDGRTAYVAQPGSDGIVAFDADPATGALARRPGAVTGNGLKNVVSVAVSADGRWVAAGSNGTQAPGADAPAFDSGVSLFGRDPATGALTPNGCVTQGGADGCADGRGLGAVIGVEVSADGMDVYAASWVSGFRQRGYVTAVRRAGAGLAQAGCLASDGAEGCSRADALRGPTSVALAPNGEHVYAATWIDESVVAFDRRPADGSLTRASCIAAKSQAAGLGCAAADFLDNPGDGAGTSQPAGLAFRGDRTLYVAERRGRTIGVLDRDPASGALSRHPGRAGCVTSQAPLTGACASGRRVSDASSFAGGSLFETQAIAAHGSTVVAGTLTNTAATAYDVGSDGGIAPVDGPLGCIAPSSALNCAAGAGFGGGMAPVDMAFSPDGRFVFAAMMREPFDAFANGAILVFRRPGGPEAPGGSGGGGSGGGGSGAPRIRASVKPRWVKARSRVILRRLRIAHVPAGARVEVRCTGRRCPFTKKRFAVRKGKVNASKAVKKGRLRAKAAIQVRITKAGATGLVVIYKVPRRGLPKGKVRCLPPGAGTPAGC